MRAWLLWLSLASSGSLIIGACGANDATGPGEDGGVSESAADQASGDGSHNGGGEDGSLADGPASGDGGGGGSGGDGGAPDTGQPLCNDPCVACLQQTCTSQVDACLADASCSAAWASYQACRCADAGSCNATFNGSGQPEKVVVGCGLTTNCQASCQF